MDNKFLDFEQPIAELQAKIEELRFVGDDKTININDEIKRLEKKCDALTKKIFSNLTPWQITQLARHPQRPYVLDYIQHIFTDFHELHGDRHYSNSPEIIAGIGKIEGHSVAIIGNQKGKSTAEKIRRNFGMAKPESYRKALRVMKLAEKFNIPVITFIDTAGAYAGIGAEERNQSEAIARNLFEMVELRTPIICIITGEGASGGALAIGVGDRILMLEHSIYSVITPEGCASILWKDATKAEEAASIMGLTAQKIKELGLIDEIIPEPMGGSHRDIPEIMETVKDKLLEILAELKLCSIDNLLEKRSDKILQYGLK
ncbi:MAG: acetyl-CoA carboxylase carboxyltransferase subunit alpha [Legionellales bacterium]|nr:acetyl-CoA carboxylase carboxyltransferase subunit alpha [Legionellales bacterium]